MMQITTAQKKALLKKNIENEHQMRRWFPLRYIDNSHETGVSKDLIKMHIVSICVLLSYQCIQMVSRAGHFWVYTMKDRITENVFTISVFSDFAPGTYQYINRDNLIGKQYVVSGTLSFDYGKYKITQDKEDVFTTDIAHNIGRIIPILSEIKGISPDMLREILKQLLCYKPFEEDLLPEQLRNKYGLYLEAEALYYTYFATDRAQIMQSKRRLLYDDLFYLAANFVQHDALFEDSGIVMDKHMVADNIIKDLPYELTADQMSTYEKIRDKQSAGIHIHAMIQGDVGCGKTITAFLQMIIAVENGHQACIMAPTKLLAMQHYDGLEKLIKNTGYKIVFCGGKKLKKSEREKIKNGTYQLIVGTHSLISSDIEFKDLVSISIDEEQKFGVAQKQAIEEKGKTANIFMLSATPIPRTLANAVFGQKTDIFNIRTMPAGRKPVKTIYDNGKNIAYMVNGILGMGQQVYVVCPAIDTEEDKMPGVLNTSQALIAYKRMFPNVQIEELTGKTTPAETDRILNNFYNGETKILISTTIVEVGVNVPNATLMIIQNAERFGLSGMHQLRGRVGRGDQQSYCMLISKTGPDENERIATLCKTNDGFEIAEKDMIDLRKPGKLFGNEQSGANRYIEEMLLYPDVYAAALQDAKGQPIDVLKKFTEHMNICEVKGHMSPILL